MFDVDENCSSVIGRKEIIDILQKKSEVSRADLPSGIEFSIKGRALNVFIKNVTQNMQNDSAAFEGWILILKCWLSDKIERVVLDFESREDLMCKYGFPEARHYNRFLYRLYNMLRTFPAWFSVEKEKMDTIRDFIGWVKSKNLVLNHSLSEREEVSDTKKMERQIESWFVFCEGKELLSKCWNIDEEKLFNQLPVGVFIDEITKENHVFPGGTSAIDIWGIDKDGQGLHLIELKCGQNSGLGVIGEILCYTFIIYDTCIAQKPLFKFGKSGSTPETRDTAAIKNGGKKFKHLTAYILAEEYHPLFSDEVADLICGGLKNLNISFKKEKYCYLKEKFVDANNDS